MPSQRRRVLLGLLVSITVLTGVILADVLGTLFFAITVAYVAEPVYRSLVDRGVAPWWASTVTTVLVFTSALFLLVPVVIIAYQRRQVILTFLETLPSEFTIELAGFTHVVVLADFLPALGRYLSSFVIGIARASPVLAVKFTLFGIVVFALLLRRKQASRAIFGAVPSDYHDVVDAFAHRIRSTLFAIYVLQAATAAGTFLVALPVFALLGYEFPFTLAIIAALLQFMPVVGPSLLVGGIGIYEFASGDPVGGALVILIGWLFIAFLPDVVIRPRLAEHTADIPGSLYFIGFTGGLLSLGPVGVIAGPLVVGLLMEALTLLAVETNSVDDHSLVEQD